MFQARILKKCGLHPNLARDAQSKLNQMILKRRLQKTHFEIGCVNVSLIGGEEAAGSKEIKRHLLKLKLQPTAKKTHQ